MNKLLTTISAFAVACVTLTASFTASAQDTKGEVKGDAKAGQSKIAMCIGCHGIVGYKTTFPDVYKAPMISGQNAKFIISSLNAYKKGERKHGSMNGIAASLSDQDMADLAAYYSEHGVVKTAAATPAKASKEPSAQVDALLKKGGCVACHGDNFAKPIDPSYPNIAGQHADYLFYALKSYKTEKNALVGRTNGIMAGVAKQYSNNELKEMSKYISSLSGDLKTVPQPGFR